MMVAETLNRVFDTQELAVACRRLVEQSFPQIKVTTRRVDVEQLAKGLSVSITRKDTVGFEGRFTWDLDGNEEIVISRNLSGRRFRFTLAHELGHLLLKRFSDSEDGGDRFSTPGFPRQRDMAGEERVANLIAAEILLPFNAVVDLLRQRRLTLSLIGELSERFDVNQNAAMRRVADLLDISLVRVSVVPNRFCNLESPAIVDDAMICLPQQRVLYQQSGVRILRRIPFSKIVSSRSVRLGLICSCGRMNADFDVSYWSSPIPNAALFAVNVIFK
jgi:Zn-dependent peptidase ImmA (M78 family)